MTDNLTIACIPIDIAQGDVPRNLAAVSEKLEQLRQEVDVIVLPELFSTGFVNDAALLGRLAETNGGATMQMVSAWARHYNAAVAGSFAARTAHHIYNRAFFVEPHGDEVFYDKRHLFSLSQERSLFAPGHEPMARIRFRGWEVAMAVCYDLRFPCWCRNDDRHGCWYDVLLIPANWPAERRYAWEHLIEARAIENQAYVVGANRSGRDGFGDYTDMTCVCDYMGQPIGETDADTGIVYATCHRQHLDKARSTFPVLLDSDRC